LIIDEPYSTFAHPPHHGLYAASHLGMVMSIGALGIRTLDNFTQVIGKDGPDARMLSATQINMFLNCPRQWYYRYIEKIPEKETFPMVKGHVVHTVCEKVFDYRPPGGESLARLKGSVANLAQEIFDKAWAENKVSERFGEEHYNEAWEVITRFLQLRSWELDTAFNKCKEAQKAWRWTCPKFRELYILDESLKVECYIDAVLERDDETILVDYKTSSIYKFPMTHEYELQLFIYALLYYRHTGILPRYVALEYLQYGKTNTIPIFMRFLEEAEDKIEQVRSKTQVPKKDEYPQNIEQRRCGFCSYHDLCGTGLKNL
jgi:putative RecB family exonuclease